MTAMKTVLDFVIDANVILFLAFCFWWVAQRILSKGRLRHNYATQLRLTKIVLVCTVLSPFLAYGAISLGQMVWPQTPFTLSDMAVAAYLKGGLSVPAADLESLLNTRGRALEGVLTGANPWLSALAAALTAGSVFHILKTLRSVLGLRRIVSASHIWHRARSTDIRLSDHVQIPFAARGLWRRHVVLPSAILTRPEELRFVLPHEFQHLRKGDVEWEMAFEVLRPLFYFNPAFLLWKRSFDRLRELGCDQALLSTRGLTPKAYAECLLNYCERQLKGPETSFVHVAFVRAQARRALAERILALRHAPINDRRGGTLTGIVCIMAIVVSVAAATVRQSGDWSQDRLMLSSIVNLERMRSANRGF